MTQQYIGTLKTLMKTKAYGFIGRDTVKLNEDGRDTPFTKDVFIHQDDCPGKLKIGQYFRFQIVPDTSRKGGFRATTIEYIGSETKDRAFLAFLGLWAVLTFAGAMIFGWGVSVEKMIAATVPSFFVAAFASLLLMRIAKSIFRWDFSVSDFVSH